MLNDLLAEQARSKPLVEVIYSFPKDTEQKSLFFEQEADPSNNLVKYAKTSFWDTIDERPNSRPDRMNTVVRTLLDSVSKIPVSFQYCYTPRNCLIEDEQALHNIPYLGDNKTITQEEGFFQDLIASYNHKIHDCKTSIPDETFVIIVDELIEKKAKEFSVSFKMMDMVIKH